jgi:hypothetical protein
MTLAVEKTNRWIRKMAHLQQQQSQNGFAISPAEAIMQLRSWKSSIGSMKSFSKEHYLFSPISKYSQISWLTAARKIG